jgi:hypothetical protein
MLPPAPLSQKKKGVHSLPIRCMGGCIWTGREICSMKVLTHRPGVEL